MTRFLRTKIVDILFRLDGTLHQLHRSIFSPLLESELSLEFGKLPDETKVT